MSAVGNVGITDATITATLRALASSRAESVESVGAAIGMTKRTVYRRTAEGGWTAAEVAAIARHFGVREQSLYDGEVRIRIEPDATCGLRPNAVSTRRSRVGRHLALVPTGPAAPAERADLAG